MHLRCALLVQVLLRWALQKGCAVIPKAAAPEHIQANAPSQLLSWELTAEHMQVLDSLEDGHKYNWDPSAVC